MLPKGRVLQYQCCGLGSGRIRIIFGSWIRIRICPKKKLYPDQHYSLNSKTLEAQNRAVEGCGRSKWSPGGFVAVFRILDILKWIRIRIRGSMPLMDPNSDPDPSIFIIDLQDANKKLIF
jgi:hypothetical protein